MNCNKCNTELKNSDIFCPNCGIEVDNKIVIKKRFDNLRLALYIISFFIYFIAIPIVVFIIVNLFVSMHETTVTSGFIGFDNFLTVIILWPLLSIIFIVITIVLFIILMIYRKKNIDANTSNIIEPVLYSIMSLIFPIPIIIRLVFIIIVFITFIHDKK